MTKDERLRRTTGRRLVELSRKAIAPLWHGAGPRDKRSQLRSKGDGLPRAQENRADRLKRRQNGNGSRWQEVRQHRPPVITATSGRGSSVFGRGVGPQPVGDRPGGCVGESSTRSASPRKGDHKLTGVARQYKRGRLGKAQDKNCQVGVSWWGVNPGALALLDSRTLPPRGVVRGTLRRVKTADAQGFHIPGAGRLPDKPAIAAELIRLTVGLGLVVNPGLDHPPTREYGRQPGRGPRRSWRRLGHR